MVSPLCQLFRSSRPDSIETGAVLPVESKELVVLFRSSRPDSIETPGATNYFVDQTILFRSSRPDSIETNALMTRTLEKNSIVPVF